MKNVLLEADHDVLPGPYKEVPDTIAPTPAVLNLVRSQVQALLKSSPAFELMPPAERQALAKNLVKIAAYSAALAHTDFALSEQLGQTPVLKQEIILEPEAQAAGTGLATALAEGGSSNPSAEEFSPRAASQVARITEQTLNAIAFPTFVADLIQGTFKAIVDSSIQQMEAYGTLLANVAKTVDQFMADNITDNQARDYLVSSYPGHFHLESRDGAPRLRVRRSADELPKPDFRAEFNLNEDIDLDDDAAEEVLVPAARRSLAQNRQQVLSTMVLLGINRIVVTSGRIQAKMGFRIDASDTGKAETASQFDFKNETTARAGFWGWSARTKTTVAYVSSSKKNSSDELNVEADLTGEVDLRFKSDHFPLERLATPQMLQAIQGNTPNPATNTPNTGSNTGGDGSNENQATA